MEIRKFQDEIAELLHPIRHPMIGAVLCLVEEIGELVKACNQNGVKSNQNGVKSTIDPWKTRCYMLQHVTST